jgi:hypothetical protein
MRLAVEKMCFIIFMHSSYETVQSLRFLHQKFELMPVLQSWLIVSLIVSEEPPQMEVQGWGTC